jgi:hypothetical protein
LTKEAATLPGHVVRHVNRFLHITTGFGENFAHLARHIPGEFFFTLDEQLGNAKQQFPALWSRHQPPRLVRFSCGGDGGVHIGLR